MNFGRADIATVPNYADFTITPFNTDFHTDTPITFTAQTNVSNPIQYLWQINGVTSGFHQTLQGPVVTDSFSVVDSFDVCLTVYITATDSITACHGLRTFSCSANFAIVADTTPHSYICRNYATGSNLRYLWDFGDSSSSMLPYPTHIYTATGYYTICLTVEDTVTGCMAVFCDTPRYFARSAGIVSLTVVKGVTGISDIAGDSPISIYPNPANDAVNIKVSSEWVGTSYTLSDLTGREIHRGALHSEITSVPATGLSAGVYIIHLRDKMYKLIKE